MYEYQQQYPPEPYPPYRPARQPAHRAWESRLITIVIKLGIIGLILALLILPVLGGLGFYAYFQVYERILPGVRAGGMHLGGLTVQEAAVQLHRHWNMERQVVVGMIVAGEIKTWAVNPAQLGLSVHAYQTARKAYDFGHGKSVIAEIFLLARSVIEGWEVQPVFIFDPQQAQAGLEAISAQISVPAVDATLVIENGQPMAVPSTPGYTLDLEQSFELLAADPEKVLAGGALPLIAKTVEPSIVDVSAVLGEAERLLNTPVIISGYDPIRDEHFTWVVPPEQLPTWVTVEAGTEGPRVLLDENKVAAYLTELSESLGPERWLEGDRYARPLVEAVSRGELFSVTVSYRPTSYTIQPGDTLLRIAWRAGMPFWKILEANPGLDPDTLLVGQELVIPSKNEMLPLPVVPDKRIVINITEQRLRRYQDGQLLSEHVISTGIDRSPTQPGVFQVRTHDELAYASVWDLYMPHFIGIYEAWPGFMNGLHGLPTLSSGRQLWAGVLGRPVSYGCIVLELQAAETLYHWAEAGVVVEILP